MRRAYSEKLMASLLALTVAAPMCYVLQLAMGIGISGWYAFLFAAGSLLLLELIAWNRITAIAIPVGLILLSAFFWWVIGKDGREVLEDFYWWALGFLSRADSYPLGYGIALTAAVSFIVTLFVWTFGRKLFFFPVLFAFVAAVVLLKWLNGMDSVLTPGALAGGGLVLLWAKSFQRKTARKTKQEMPANGLALLLLPVAALMVLLSLTTVTEDAAKNWQSRQVYDLFERVNNYVADYTNFNRPRNVFSISAYGFMPMGTRLGGPIQLSETKVLTVTAPRRMLLRGIVYNNYTGNKWTDTTNSPTYRLDNANRSISDNVFDEKRPALTGAEKEDYERFIEHITLSVNPLIYSSSALFVPSRGVTEITSDKLFAILPKFNAKGEAFNTYDIHPGYSYKIVADNLINNAAGFDAMMDRLMEMGLRDTPEQEKYIKACYLAVQKVDNRVFDLTNDIISGKTIDVSLYNKMDGDTKVTSWSYPVIGNDYEKALAIKEFLMKFYHYTLKPSVPDEHVDFVSHFILDEPQGYCTYFASAMAMMARIAGIPSRYVEGYQLPDKSSTDAAYTVSGKDAHAWAELYFEGIGWLPFDATPSGDGNSNPSTGGASTIDPFPTPTHSAGNGDTGLDLNAGNKEITWKDIEPYLWTLPATLAAAVILWILFMMVRSKMRVSQKHVQSRYRDLNRCCAFYYTESLKLLTYYNYPVKTGETPYAYAARIDKWLRLESGTFAEAANLISLLSYSDYHATDKDMDFMAKFRQALAKYTYNTVGPWFYLWHQVLGFKRKATPVQKG